MADAVRKRKRFPKLVCDQPKQRDFENRLTSVGESAQDTSMTNTTPANAPRSTDCVEQFDKSGRCSAWTRGKSLWVHTPASPESKEIPCESVAKARELWLFLVTQ